jgi:glycosyltransferase involved in cell wall biosynthesis
MKIAYIVSDINKAVFFENTALALRADGFDVCYIVINYENGAFVEFLQSNGFSYYTLKSNKLSQSLPQILKVRKILKQEQITLVHCHLAQANFIGLWAAFLNRIPHRIYTRHSGEPLKLMWKERILDFFQNRLATTIISISQVIDELLEKQNVPSYKRTIVHHGFELKRFTENDIHEVQRIKNEYNPNSNYPVIGVIARWMKWKGIQDIIEGFILVLETHPNALLCLFGATGVGDYHENLSKLLLKIPAKNVRIVPFENNVFDLYQLFDVYVHVPVNPTCEAFGQTYVEALASKIPSVFTKSGIAREFVTNEEHALVVPFENPKAISEAVQRILSNPNEVHKMTEKGLKTVTDLFDFSVYQRNLTAFYQTFQNASFRKKIIYVVSDVNRAVYFEQTAIALRNLNFDVVFVLVSCKNSPLDIFLRTNGFKCHYLTIGKLMKASLIIWKLRKIFKHEKPFLIHTHLSKASWVGLNAAWLAGIKRRIYTRHSGKPLTPHFKEAVIDSIQNKLATRIISVSENISSILSEQNVSPQKLTIVHHGFELERFQNVNQDELTRIKSSYNPERKHPVIGVISRWMELKGIDFVVDAFSKIMEKFPNALLCIFGENKNDEYAKKLLKRLSAIPAENYKIIPFENNCFDLYQLFDIYVHVPINETCEAFGQTYVEALAAGIPSVFTKSGIAREFIHDEKNALVVPFQNSEAIYQSCMKLMTNKDLRDRLVENGRKSVESFNFDSYINSLVDVYNL